MVTAVQSSKTNLCATIQPASSQSMLQKTQTNEMSDFEVHANKTMHKDDYPHDHVSNLLKHKNQMLTKPQVL